MSKRYYDAPIICTYSGGKDSDVLLDLFIRSGVEFEAHNSHTTVDAPDTVYYIREKFRGLKEKGIPCIIHMPPLSMWQLIVKKKMPPTRMQRYCCEILYRKKAIMERNRKNSCFYRTFPLSSFHNTFITSVQDLSAKTKGHRFFAMTSFHLL